MTSVVACSILQVPHQALHGCTHWLCLTWDHTLVARLHPLLYYEFLLCKLFWGHIPPIVTTNSILCQRWGLGHLLWDFCDQYRLWCLAPTATLWTSLVFPLWPAALFLWHCISVAFRIVSCWRTLLACYLELSRLPTVLQRHPCRSKRALKRPDRLGLSLLQLQPLCCQTPVDESDPTAKVFSWSYSFWWFLFLRTLPLGQWGGPAFHYVLPTCPASIVPFRGNVLTP